MMKNIFLKSIIAFLLLASTFSYAQSFEGKIEYRLDTKNPIPEKISDEDWNQKMKEKLGGVEYMIQKYTYKESNYLSEVSVNGKSSFQLYKPTEALLYNWEEGTNVAATYNTKENKDAIVEIKEYEVTEKVLDIDCKKITIISEQGEVSYWYNEDYLKMDPKLYAGHKFSHFEEFLKKTNSLPLKIELKQVMVHMVFTALKYEDMKIDDNIFTLPKFEEIIKL